MTGDLLLEWALRLQRVTAEFRRIWFLADGTFRLNIVDWIRRVRREVPPVGHRHLDLQGGLHDRLPTAAACVVKIGLTTTGGTGDEVLAFGNADPSAVYVGGPSPSATSATPRSCRTADPDRPAIECALPWGA